MDWYFEIKEYFEKEIAKSVQLERFTNLYKPVQHILSIGGKRMRPIALLKTCLIYGETLETALPAAMAIEWFHNFSLVHDDLMDNADLRRGNPTVHTKYNSNQAILSGDVMLAKANEMIIKLDGHNHRSINLLFNKTAIEVCEGQQLDLDFETRDTVALEEYIEMIKLKTAVLFAASLKIGALIADAPEQEADYLYQFGINAGLAFQIQDDYLDSYGAEDFGKQIGGDIIQSKKTFLICKALELANPNQSEQLVNLLKMRLENEEKVKMVMKIFTDLDVAKYAIAAQKDYYDKAIEALNKCNSLSSQSIAELKELADAMVVRLT